jgi:redox-sensitive bicupin YhaK (pirin superfamily)
MGFRSLRVINEDRVAPGRGFGMHGHRDMEILSYVLEGQLGHKDNMGHEEVLGPNEIQRMSAGTGVTHSEFNASKTEGVHFMQIWIQPSKAGVKPSYEQLKFGSADKQGRFKLLAGPESGEGVTKINADALMLVAELAEGDEAEYELGVTRHAWVHVIRGSVEVNGTRVKTGDAAAVSGEENVSIRGMEGSEVLLFDLA